LSFGEATSGLDEASAEHIGETVNRLRGKATVLFVAHKVPKCLRYDGEVRLGGG
jgi:ATP-binding cassette, subfamily B, bacterial HlyB/CyaB